MIATATATESQHDEIRIEIDTSMLPDALYRGLVAALTRAGVAQPTDPDAPIRWEIGSRSGSWFALRVRVSADPLAQVVRT